MSPEVLLLIHNAGHVASSLAAIGFIIVLILRKGKTSIDIAFIFCIVGSLVFSMSHLIGVNIADPEISRNVLLFNLAVIPLSAFVAHTILGQIDGKRYHRQIIFFYIISGLFFFFFLIFPSYYLQESVPKLYFPNYYVPGSLRWLSSLVFLILIPLYGVLQMFRAGLKTSNPITKSRLFFFSLVIVTGYGFGNVADYLVYDIPINPILSILFIPIFSVIVVYTIYKYQLFDIKVIAKRAFLFAIQVSAMSVFFTMLSFLNQWVVGNFPIIPVWGVPLLSSIAVVLIGILVWNRVRETDMLKYEFITIITHKFRTPLTRIKYAIADIKSTSIAEEKKMEIEEIEHSASVLVDLTGELVTLTESEKQSHSFTAENIVMGKFVESIVPLYSDRITNKKINFSIEDTSEGAHAVIDTTYMKSVMQVLLENALTYTPVGGKVVVGITADRKLVTVQVSDSGVGIPKSELNLVFSKFFRGEESAKIDTEGMGIGLFITKNIIERHKGKIWVTSDGVGKGTSFFVGIPRGK